MYAATFNIMNLVRNMIKNLRYLLGASIGVVFLFCCVCYSSCNKDACKNTSCKNDGVCKDGTCLCAFMYEGSLCQTETRNSYYGTYRGDGTNSEGDTYINWALKFYQSGTSTQLGLDILTDNDSSRASLIIQMQTTDSFTILPQTGSSTVINGYGKVNSKNASLTLIDSTEALNVYFTNMQKK